MTRRLLALAVGAASLLPVVVLTATTAGAAPTATIGPTVSGWWSAARPDSVVPAAPTFDVGPGDLYVAGSHALPALPDGAPAIGPVGPVAVSALRFDLPDGATAGELRFRLAGTAPPFVTVSACRALGPFSAEQGGSWADAPAYDCAEAASARVADGQVVLEGVDRLRRGTDLSVVLVPGPLDRVVLAAPGSGTLTLTTAPGSSAPPSLEPAPPVGTGAPAAVTGVLGPPAAPLVGSPPAAPAVVPRPVAPSVAPPLVAVPVPASAAASPSRPWPVLVATLLLATLAFVPLARPRQSSGPSGAAAERGVGRFRSPREGRAPELS